MHVDQSLTTINVIYLDMDGVLVDLEKILGDIEGTPIPELRKTWNDPKFDLVIHLMRKHKDKEVFIKAPKMPNIQQVDRLIEVAPEIGISVQILSSGSKQPDLFPTVVKEKMRWLQIHGYHNLPVHFAKGGSTKRLWAAPHTLLIDDYEPNCRNFNEAGGKTILYNHETSLSDELARFGINISL